MGCTKLSTKEKLAHKTKNIKISFQNFIFGVGRKKVIVYISNKKIISIFFKMMLIRPTCLALLNYLNFGVGRNFFNYVHTVGRKNIFQKNKLCIVLELN